MAKKTFRLEQVLNYRKEVEKVRTIEFSAAKEQFEDASDDLQREENAADQVSRELHDRERQGMSVLEWQIYANFFERKNREIREKREEVVTLEKDMMEKREVLLHASREKKVLENLKEKKMLSHRREQQEKEREFLDEIAVQNYRRG
jgi:flagellar FliJ protein